MAKSGEARIFLLEDDPVVVDLVRSAVEFQGWSLRHADLVTGAVEALKKFRAQVAVLDLSLPDGEGFAVCRDIRADPSLSGVTVIFLTSKGDIENRLTGFKLGAQDYMIKPFDPQELVARLSAHLAVTARQHELERKLQDSLVHERVRQDVADMVVHDLRAPLSTVKVTLDLVRKAGLIENDQGVRILSYAEDSVDFALLMVNDLLDLGKGEIETHPGPVEIARLFERLGRVAAIQYQLKKVALAFEPAPAAALRSDQTLLFRILSNLIGNALKFSGAGQRVTVSARPAGKRAPSGMRFEVVDQGPGIPEDEKEAVFDKFYRARQAVANSIPGSGIGLAFCRLACAALKGRVWVEDNPGGGSRFVLEVPSLRG